MAKKNKPLSVYVALDRSGSMQGERWTHAIDSINEYINGLKNEEIEGEVNVTAFDTNGNSVRLVELVEGQSIAYYEPLAHDVATPSGMTPLFDAAANVMDRALENNADRTIVVIMTDGEENSSKEYNQSKIKDKVKVLEAKKWEVVFLGANFDVTQYTVASGLASTKMRNVDFSNQFQRTAMQADLTRSTVAYAVAGQAINLNVDIKVKD
jgi:uncharacterized protein YegL